MRMSSPLAEIGLFLGHLSAMHGPRLLTTTMQPLSPGGQNLINDTSGRHGLSDDSAVAPVPPPAFLTTAAFSPQAQASLGPSRDAVIFTPERFAAKKTELLNRL
jgi:hypothetical protein